MAHRRLVLGVVVVVVSFVLRAASRRRADRRPLIYRAARGAARGERQWTRRSTAYMADDLRGQHMTPFTRHNQ